MDIHLHQADAISSSLPATLSMAGGSGLVGPHTASSQPAAAVSPVGAVAGKIRPRLSGLRHDLEKDAA